MHTFSHSHPAGRSKLYHVVINVINETRIHPNLTSSSLACSDDVASTHMWFYNCIHHRTAATRPTIQHTFQPECQLISLSPLVTLWAASIETFRSSSLDVININISSVNGTASNLGEYQLCIRRILITQITSRRKLGRCFSCVSPRASHQLLIMTKQRESKA